MTSGYIFKCQSFPTFLPTPDFSSRDRGSIMQYPKFRSMHSGGWPFYSSQGHLNLITWYLILTKIHDVWLIHVHDMFSSRLKRHQKKQSLGTTDGPCVTVCEHISWRFMYDGSETCFHLLVDWIFMWGSKKTRVASVYDQSVPCC